MESFKSFINEGFVNVVLDRDTDTRLKYAGAVWDLLQRTYSKIGGIKGSGFSSKEDMIASIPMWKLYVRNGKIIVCVLYKDKSGRKAVAIATDGTKQASKILASVMKSDFKVAFGEYSKAMLVFIFKNTNFKILEPYILLPSEVATLYPDEDIAIPTDQYVADNLESADQAIYKRFAEYKKYFYVRTIGGSLFLKMAIGTPDAKIV